MSPRLLIVDCRLVYDTFFCLSNTPPSSHKSLSIIIRKHPAMKGRRGIRSRDPIHHAALQEHQVLMASVVIFLLQDMIVTTLLSALQPPRATTYKTHTSLPSYFDLMIRVTKPMKMNILENFLKLIQCLNFVFVSDSFVVLALRTLIMALSHHVICILTHRANVLKIVVSRSLRLRRIPKFTTSLSVMKNLLKERKNLTT